MLDSLDAVANGVAAVTEEALATLLLGYADVNDMTVQCAHAQMEEGSEHYLAYHLERLTGQSFVHGEVVTLAVVIMSRSREMIRSERGGSLTVWCAMAAHAARVVAGTAHRSLDEPGTIRARGWSSPQHRRCLPSRRAWPRQSPRWARLVTAVRPGVFENVTPMVVDSRSLASRLKDRLRQLILDGSLSAGAHLPTEPELADHFRVSRATVREALKQLENEGTVIVRRGRGRFVLERARATSANCPPRERDRPAREPWL